eukprot:jgi/Botrbrau1/15508/Bobra.0225s0001.3
MCTTVLGNVDLPSPRPLPHGKAGTSLNNICRQAPVLRWFCWRSSVMKKWSDIVDLIASNFAFFPPAPPTYKVLEHKDGQREFYIQPVVRGYPKVLNCKVVEIRTRLGQTIIGAYFPRSSRAAGFRVPTILFSHGNAVDLGVLLGFFRELGRDLNVAVMCYDYTGYGGSSGKPSVENTLADIDAVYEWLRNQGADPSDIVLYGQSVGSGPTGYLAAKEPRLAGVILHSPLASGQSTCLLLTTKTQKTGVTGPITRRFIASLD